MFFFSSKNCNFVIQHWYYTSKEILRVWAVTCAIIHVQVRSIILTHHGDLKCEKLFFFTMPSDFTHTQRHNTIAHTAKPTHANKFNSKESLLISLCCGNISFVVIVVVVAVVVVVVIITQRKTRTNMLCVMYAFANINLNWGKNELSHLRINSICHAEYQHTHKRTFCVCDVFFLFLSVFDS